MIQTPQKLQPAIHREIEERLMIAGYEPFDHSPRVEERGSNLTCSHCGKRGGLHVEVWDTTWCPGIFGVPVMLANCGSCGWTMPFEMGAF